MRVKFLLNQNLRVKGIPHVFEPGQVYDLDAATVGGFGLLNKVDGFGVRCFEAVKDPPPPVGPVPTPEEVHVETREKRQAEIAAKQKEAVVNRKAEAEAKAAAKPKIPKKPTKEAPTEDPEEKPTKPPKTPPADLPPVGENVVAPAGKLAGRLGKKPK